MDALQVEFRRRIVDAYLAGGVTQDEVAERFAVSRSSVQKFLAQWRRAGALEPMGHGGGRSRVVQGELEEKLLQAVADQPDATLRELQETCGIPGCKMNVHRALERLEMTLKKKTVRCSEPLEPEIAQERAAWPTVMQDVDPKRLHFLDESCAKTIMTRLYGRAKRGVRVIDDVPDGRWESWTMLGALTASGAGPMLTYSGGTDVATMTTDVAECLAPTLSSGDVVVMDNLSAHKHADVVAAIEATGAKVRFLPRDSPDRIADHRDPRSPRSIASTDALNW